MYIKWFLIVLEIIGNAWSAIVENILWIAINFQTIVAALIAAFIAWGIVLGYTKRKDKKESTRYAIWFNIFKRYYPMFVSRIVDYFNWITHELNKYRQQEDDTIENEDGYGRFSEKCMYILDGMKYHQDEFFEDILKKENDLFLAINKLDISETEIKESYDYFDKVKEVMSFTSDLYRTKYTKKDIKKWAEISGKSVIDISSNLKEQLIKDEEEVIKELEKLLEICNEITGVENKIIRKYRRDGVRELIVYPPELDK